FLVAVNSTFEHEDYKGVQLDPLILPPAIKLIPAIGGNVTANGGFGVPNLSVVLKQGGTVIGNDLTDTAGTYYIQDLSAGNYVQEVRSGIGDLVATKNTTVLGDQATNFIDFVVP